MPSFGRHRLRRRLTRCIVIAGCAVAYLATAIGCPVAVRSGEDKIPSLVSQPRACGCSVVAQCLHCCCCCRQPAPAVTEETAPPASESHSCCAKHKKARPAPLAVRWVLGQMSQQCQGSALAWVAVGATLPLPPVTVYPDYTPAERLSPRHITATADRPTPPAPPPRAA